MKILSRFGRDEEGLALTEYLLLLGILSVLVIAAVFLFRDALGGIWVNWAAWFAPQSLSNPTT